LLPTKARPLPVLGLRRRDDGAILVLAGVGTGKVQDAYRAAVAPRIVEASIAIGRLRPWHSRTRWREKLMLTTELLEQIHFGFPVHKRPPDPSG
jgi:hypothetical protein